ncbi:hypothetical protein DI09_23p50 [Mitosporidium daphniae]|uniref:Uncharacterized protein n=1 Tax=Mitosporidium daphniae TaxID=1485682 RepID=A0A098VSJ7_9MICR|nr:uncharacterized protein DI09_23p50 [Mitosporidium daphniae]KGG51930.1 hypothetical protein DI09_23p50 [Mitosporidium daphniae]|eukprot:XP_013238384.1 uncharacterized protein DI09_23p50 [Mitosporidium daphniae]
MEPLSPFPTSFSPNEISDSNDPSSSSLSASDTDLIQDASLEEEDITAISDQSACQDLEAGSLLSKDIDVNTGAHMPTIRLKLVNILKSSNQPLLRESLGKCISALKV